MDLSQKPPKNRQGKPSKPKKQLEAYARYSTLAFQMIFIILAGVFGGMKLDQWIRWEFPVFTVILTIVAVLLSMYYAIRDLMRFK